MKTAHWVLAVLAVAACTGGEDASPASAWVLGPDSLARAVLIDVQDADSTLLVEARYATTDNFTGSVLPGYEAGRVLLRHEVAAALARVQRRLQDDGLALRLYDGYRPVRATLGMVEWTERVGRVDLLDDGYIARRSRHNLGVAIDLTLVDASTGAALDMGTPYDTFDERAHTMNATGDVLANRLRLKAAMEAEGFVNYENEWWHYSYPVEGAVPFDLVIAPREAAATTAHDSVRTP